MIICVMARKEQSQRDKDRRIQDIIDASKIIFFDKGFINTTMQDIAAGSELSRRTIYLYFKSKEEISFEIAKRAFKSLQESATLSMNSSKKGFEKLIDFKDAYMELFKEEFSNFYFTVFLDFKIYAKLVSKESIRELLSIINEIVNKIEECVIEGIKDGSIKPDVTNIRCKSIAAINIIHATMQKIAIRKDLLESFTGFSSSELIEETFGFIFTNLKNN